MATAKVSLSPYQQFPKTQRIVVNNKFLLSKLVYLIGHPKTLHFVQLGSSAQPCVSVSRAMLAGPCWQSHADYYTVVHCPRWAMACCACAPSLNHSFFSLPCDSRWSKPPQLGVRHNTPPMMRKCIAPDEAWQYWLPAHSLSDSSLESSKSSKLLSSPTTS